MAEELFDALFALNKYARTYASKAAQAYDDGWKTQAREHSLRKRALYQYKTHILEQLFEDDVFDRVEQHEIDGEAYYCFYRGEYSFHSPTGQWEDREVHIETAVQEERSLEDFSPADAEHTNELMDEYEALGILSREFGSPNEFLPQVFLNSDHRSWFAGWSNLPGAVEEGDPVPESEFLDTRGGEFLLATGDWFDTVEQGEVEILDRYGAWLDDRHYGGSVQRRPVYDVYLRDVDEQRDAVREETIHDDWRIRLHSTVEPVGSIDGKIADQFDGTVESAPPLETGDKLVLESYTDEGPVEYRVGSLTVSWSVVMVELQPINDENHEEHLALEEIQDDILDRQ